MRAPSRISMPAANSATTVAAIEPDVGTTSMKGMNRAMQSMIDSGR